MALTAFQVKPINLCTTHHAALTRLLLVQIECAFIRVLYVMEMMIAETEVMILRTAVGSVHNMCNTL